MIMKLSFLYKYEVEYHIWEKSYLYDVDGEERSFQSTFTFHNTIHHFLFSGIMSRSILLMMAAVLFAPCHILISYKNATRKG